jgi:hypothetical protein
MTSKRELIAPKGDKRFIRRDEAGRIKESDDVGRSLAADRARRRRVSRRRGRAIGAIKKGSRLLRSPFWIRVIRPHEVAVRQEPAKNGLRGDVDWHDLANAKRELAFEGPAAVFPFPFVTTPRTPSGIRKWRAKQKASPRRDRPNGKTWCQSSVHQSPSGGLVGRSARLFRRAAPGY